MTRDDVITRLKASEPQIRVFGVSALYLYGSYARDEARSDSDLDVFVDFETGRGAPLTEFLRPYHLLEQQFPGMDIGYGTRDSLVAPYRQSIEKSAIRIF